MRMRAGFLVISFLFAVVFFADVVFAAQIKATNNKRILIDLETSTFKVGDILNIKNASGKVVGITKIVRIKGKLAEGMLKGKAEVGFELSLRPPKAKGQQRPKASAAAREDDDEDGSSSNSDPSSLKMMIGGMGGYNMTSMDATLPTTSTDVSLDGSGFSLKALIDVPFFSWASFRGLAGFEQMNVEGASNSECSGACIVEITYLTADFWGRYMINLGESPIKPWVGGGFSILFPMSKKASAISESSITNTNVFSIGGGVDWGIGNNAYIPLQIEYNLYPSTDSVKTTAITIRGGYAMPF